MLLEIISMMMYSNASERPSLDYIHESIITFAKALPDELP